MRFLLGHGAGRSSFATLLAATLLSPNAAHAFCRTTTKELPASYNPVAGCFTEGLVLFWRNACVGYSVNQTASRTIAYQDAKRIIDESFATWTNVTCRGGSAPPGISVSDLGAVECDEVRYNKTSANQNLIVFRDEDWPYRGANSTLGLTTVSFNPETGELRDVDMEINATGGNLSVTDQVPANGFDLASIITHEAGHFFGLAHATSPSSTMYASAKPGAAILRSLTQDDIDGICAIYPNAKIRSVSSALSSNETLAADSCNPNPERGLTSACVSSVTSKDTCAASPKHAPPWGLSASVSLTVGCLLIARRRRPR